MNEISIILNRLTEMTALESELEAGKKRKIDRFGKIQLIT